MLLAIHPNFHIAKNNQKQHGITLERISIVVTQRAITGTWILQKKFIDQL